MAAITVGKWALGFSRSQNVVLLRLEFTDREPIDLAIAPDEAEKIAKAILDQSRVSTQRH